MRIRILFILSILLMLLPACVQHGLRDGSYRVYRVIDGDTIILHDVGRVRLADVHAPELDTPEGPQARDELAARIEGKVVRVEFTRRKKASCAGPAGSVVFDRYGRLLAKIRPKPLSLQSSTHTSAPSMGWAASE